MNELSPNTRAEVDPGEESREPASAGIVPTALLFYAAMGVLALGIAWLRDTPLLWTTPGWGAADWAQALAFGVGGALGTILLSECMTRWTHWGEALSRALAENLGPLSLMECWILALASGIAEEALFRGALQPWLGVLFTSLLFGFVHFVPRRDFLPWTGFALLAGFGLAGLYVATGSLLAPIVAHVGVNGINLRRLTRDFATR